MQVPHIKITETHWLAASKKFTTGHTVMDVCNKAIEIALAEQSQEQSPVTTGFDGLTNLEIAAKAIESEMIRQSEKAIQEFDVMESDLAGQEQYITADEARKLGAGNAEWRWDGGEWAVVNGLFPYFTEAQYRAIKNPEPQQAQYPSPYKKEPVEPHAELRAMYAQQVKNTADGKAGGLDDFVWEYRSNQFPEWSLSTPLFSPSYQYRCTPKPTCQIKNLDTGITETMTREKAKLLQAETKDVCDWFEPENDTPYSGIFIFNADGIYTYKRKESEPTTIVNSERMTLSAAEALKVKLGDSVEWFDWSPMRSQTKSIGNWKFSAEDFYSYTEKANLVKLNGKLVTREAAIAEWESKKSTCDIWIKNDVTIGWEMTNLTRKFIVYAHECNCEYELRERPLKQISWTGSREDVITLLNEVLNTGAFR